MNSVIKLYSPFSELSEISDEVIDLRDNVRYFTIEIRDNVLLENGQQYSLRIHRADLLRFESFFVYNNSNLIRITIDQVEEHRINTLTSKKPFKIKINDQNNNCLAQGIFYRYKSLHRATHPSEWDNNYCPNDHRDYLIKTGSLAMFKSENKNNIKNLFQMKKSLIKNSQETEKSLDNDPDIRVLAETRERAFTKVVKPQQERKQDTYRESLCDISDNLAFFTRFLVLYIMFDLIKLAFKFCASSL
ncbi:unnamed protein product [Brachionus calyciflorus]|uniref:Uncharacterized protein n=1 Tax=Brachionus calyciflorus TaxID=104777 RepID=A0A813Y1J7_9BILA|nr:unnamed protein product [Brachionus calyciflorus]